MHRTWLIGVVLTLAATPLYAAEWADGDQCVAKKRIRISAKPKGKGKKTKLKRGAELTVVEAYNKYWLKVHVDDNEGYVKVKLLDKSCNKVEPKTEEVGLDDVLGGDGDAAADKSSAADAPPPPPEPPVEPPPTEPEPATPKPTPPPSVQPAATKTTPKPDSDLSFIPAAVATSVPEGGETTVAIENAKKAAAEAAEELSNQLTKTLGQAPSMVFMTPFRKPGGDTNAAIFVSAFAAELLNRGMPLIDRESVKKSLEEAALMQGVSDAALSELAGAFGADVILAGSIDLVGSSYSINIRAVSVATAELITSSKASFATEGEVVASEAASVESQIRRLGDRLAEGLNRMSGDLRYQKVAVLPFEEQGGTTKDRELGLLVSSELTTVLRRDHGVMLVERSQLKSVIDELALGQTGLVDPSRVIEVGKMSGAQGLVIGNVAEAGDRYLVNARVVAAETGEVVFADDVPLPAADLVALSSESVVLRTRSGAVYRSLLLPGWGQIYNRQSVKGWVFAGAEAAAFGAVIGMHFRGLYWDGRYDDLASGASLRKFERMHDNAEQAYLWRNISLYIAIGIHLANVLDAFLSGQTYDPASIEPRSHGAVFTW